VGGGAGTYHKDRLKFGVVLTHRAEEDLENIPNPVLRDQTARRIDSLAENPEAGRQPRYMSGLYSLRASSAHYRIIYRVLEGRQLVVVIAIIKVRGDDIRKAQPFYIGDAEWRIGTKKKRRR